MTGNQTLDKAIELLRVAKCSNCDGSGGYEAPLGENFVSHEMAMDAGEPSMEGQSMGIEYGLVQCQWCDERRTILELAVNHEENGHTEKKNET